MKFAEEKRSLEEFELHGQDREAEYNVKLQAFDELSFVIHGAIQQFSMQEDGVQRLQGYFHIDLKTMLAAILTLMVQEQLKILLLQRIGDNMPF